MADAMKRRDPSRNLTQMPANMNERAVDSADVEDDRHDPERAHEIASRHHARHPAADPIIPTRPRAPLTGWLWLSALAAFVAMLAVAVIASRF